MDMLMQQSPKLEYFSGGSRTHLVIIQTRHIRLKEDISDFFNILLYFHRHSRTSSRNGQIICPLPISDTNQCIRLNQLLWLAG